MIGIYRDYPIPAESSKARCSVLDCPNVASVLVVIRMPHPWLFDRPKWGEPGKIERRAPGSATFSFCSRCAHMAGYALFRWIVAWFGSDPSLRRPLFRIWDTALLLLVLWCWYTLAHQLL